MGNSSPPEINRLSPGLINQIKAGEVIGRPSAVLKELLENALDSRADRIDVVIEAGGIRRICVRDNGHGMTPEQMDLALLSHATSKISSLEDLQSIRSFGFRGEALPSIASICRLTMRSSSANQQHGHQITCEAGQKTSSTEAVRIVGTSVDVQDLFFNIPARRKFLKTENTELRHTQMIFRGAVLAHREVSFSWRSNKQVWDFKKDDMKSRLDRFLGSEFVSMSRHFDQADGAWRFSGWLGQPQVSRANADHCLLFLNRRPIYDRQLAFAARRAYQDILERDRSPSYVIFIDTDPQNFDVNVHPGKLEVRFADAKDACDRLYSAIKRSLARSADPDLSPVPKLRMERSLARNSLKEPELTNANLRYTAQAPLAKKSAPKFAPSPSIDRSQRASEAAYRFAKWSFAASTVSGEEKEPLDPFKNAPLGRAIAQLHDTYVLAESKKGLIIVDMHAAHERIRYERLKKDYAKGSIVSQGLIVPVAHQISETEGDIFDEHANEVKKMGFDAVRSATDRITINAVPQALIDNDHRKIFNALLSDLAEHGSSQASEQRVFDRLSKMACVGAIKHGHKLSSAQMDALLRQMEETDNADHCNHGRPSWTLLSLKDLDSWVQRGR